MIRTPSQKLTHMTTFDVLLYGTSTLDKFYYKSKLTTDYGAIHNVNRNLKRSLSTKKVSTQGKIVEMYLDGSGLKNIIDKSNTNGFLLNPSHTYNWGHIAYLDWVKPSIQTIENLRKKCTYLTADIAGLTEKGLQGLEQYEPYLDILFCSSSQMRKLGDEIRQWPFIFWHGDSAWQFHFKAYHFFQKDYFFNIGAGDTLVASVLNTCKSPMEILSNFDKIHNDLHIRLKKRDEWAKQIF